MATRLLLLFVALLFVAESSLAEMPAVKAGVYRWVEHPVKVSGDRESRKILEGSSPHLEYLEVHATTQMVGAKPSTAHASEDTEELIIVKEGLMRATIEGESKVLAAGSVISLMPQQMHSLANVGDTPLTYFVFKYRSRKPMDLERGVASGGSQMLSINELPLETKPGRGSRKYFDRATAMCERIEMHVTQLHSKGPSHTPHTHTETEVILMISGESDMVIDGKKYEATAGDFYFMDADSHHGVGNPTDKPCCYFAFKWN